MTDSDANHNDPSLDTDAEAPNGNAFLVIHLNYDSHASIYVFCFPHRSTLLENLVFHKKKKIEFNHSGISAFVIDSLRVQYIENKPLIWFLKHCFL